MRELHADTEAVWEERGELLDDIRGMAARLEEAARQAAARLRKGNRTRPAGELMIRVVHFLARREGSDASRGEPAMTIY